MNKVIIRNDLSADAKAIYDAIIQKRKGIWLNFYQDDNRCFHCHCHGTDDSESPSGSGKTPEEALRICLKQMDG